MTKHRPIMAILSMLMVIALSVSAYAANFGFDIYVDASAQPSLTFGLRASPKPNDILPSVPNFELIKMCRITFGAYTEAGDTTAQDFIELFSAVLPGDAATTSKTWTVNVTDFKEGSSSATLKFKANSIGSLPSNSSLKFHKVFDDAGEIIKDGKEIKIEEIGTYYITYTCPSGTTRYPTPESLLSEQGSYGQYLLLPIDKNASFKFSDATAFAKDKDVVGTLEYETLVPLNLAVNTPEKTSEGYVIELPTDTEAKVIQINYCYADDSNNAISDNGLIVITLVDGITAKADKSVVTFSEEKMSNSLVYTINSSVSENIAVELGITANSQNDVPYTVKYAFSQNADATPNTDLALDDYSESGRASNTIPLSVTNGTYYLILSITAAEKSSNSAIYATISTHTGLENKLDRVLLHYSSGGISLDFDENGAITLDDAIMFYNFMALGGIKSTRTRPAQLLSFTTSVTEADATIALQNFKDNFDKLDFDSFNGTTLDDAIMFYNFMALGGIKSTRTRPAQLLSFTTTVTEDDAAIALEFFKTNAAK